MKDDVEARKKRAKEEFEEVITTYIMPLFDIRGNVSCSYGSYINSELVSISKKDAGQATVCFYPQIGTNEKPSPFCYMAEIYPSEAMKKPAASILRELLKVTEYQYNESFSIKRAYGKSNARQSSYKNRTLDLAFELGMCQWIVPGVEEKMHEAVVLHTIICRMLEWAGRTYEGKNVPFGIVIDFDKVADDNAADYLHFLTNDSSAVFTDGIFTGILLDKNGKVLSFLTRNTSSEKQIILEERNIFVPYQFLDMAQYCVDACIGIIVLTNGEILLIKNQAVQFAKRGSKWICFDWNRVYSGLRRYFLAGGYKDETVIRKNIQEIYCTLLDVSFAHTGGCLALVLPEKEADLDDVIKERIDLFIAGSVPDGIKKENIEKIEVLTYLLGAKKNNMNSFFEIEKPLRKEILTLDGATVVSMNGTFYCVGSIVAVPGGSPGGGRTAASQRLAQYGVGIKISEDGYIEAYGLDISNPNDSFNIVQIFKFR